MISLAEDSWGGLINKDSWKIGKKTMLWSLRNPSWLVDPSLPTGYGWLWLVEPASISGLPLRVQVTQNGEHPQCCTVPADWPSQNIQNMCSTLMNENTVEKEVLSGLKLMPSKLACNQSSNFIMVELRTIPWESLVECTQHPWLRYSPLKILRWLGSRGGSSIWMICASLLLLLIINCY